MFVLETQLSVVEQKSGRKDVMKSHPLKKKNKMMKRH